MQFWLSHLFLKYVIQLCNFGNLKKYALNTFRMNLYEPWMITSNNSLNFLYNIMSLDIWACPPPLHLWHPTKLVHPPPYYN
jgi:hypothetical protein